MIYLESESTFDILFYLTLNINLVCLDDTFNAYTFNIPTNLAVNIHLVYHLTKHENTLNIYIYTFTFTFNIPLYIYLRSFHIPIIFSYSYWNTVDRPCHIPWVYHLIYHEYTFFNIPSIYHLIDHENMFLLKLSIYLPYTFALQLFSKYIVYCFQWILHRLRELSYWSNSVLFQRDITRLLAFSKEYCTHERVLQSMLV